MSVAPLLDNIETTCAPSKRSKSLTDKAFRENFDEKLYTLLELDFEKYKKLSIEVSEALRFFSNNDKLKEKGKVMQSCGFELGFIEDRLVDANFCRIRLCPMCQRRKSLRTYSDFVKMLDLLTDYAFLHLTLTVPNCSFDELSDTITFLNKCSSKFFSLPIFKKAFHGVVRTLEVSYNSVTNKMHPHFHILIAVRPSYFKSRVYIKSDRIQQIWSLLWKHREENLRGKKWTLEHLDTLPLADDELLQTHITKADNGALPEIAKYAVKPIDFECSLKERAKVLDCLYSALNGKRMVFLSGVFKDVAKKLKIDLEASEPLPAIDKNKIVYYYWNYRQAHYESEG
ncbi:MAG: hypothetical protein E7547_02500 [Ruminococcaceae bacterium]|nr:hypothetical protein [Oscillospiraceae bacterium]